MFAEMDSDEPGIEEPLSYAKAGFTQRVRRPSSSTPQELEQSKIAVLNTLQSRICVQDQAQLLVAEGLERPLARSAVGQSPTSRGQTFFSLPPARPLR